ELDQFDSDGNVTGTRTTVPIVTSQEVETTVLIKNNRTLVLGGLIEDTESKTMRKFPILGDIPLVGAMFKNETVDNTKSEVVIFLTPSIIEDHHYEGFEDSEGKYLGDEGKFKDFNQVGDESYDYREAYGNSMNPFAKENKPYWQRKQDKITEEVIEHFNQKESQTEPTLVPAYPERSQQMQASSVAQEMERDARRASARRQDALTPIARSTASSVIPQNTLSSREAYITAVSEKINRNVAQKRELAPYRGTTSTVILNVLRDGTIDSIGFSKVGVFSQPEVRTSLTESIVSTSPLPRFSPDMPAQQERLEVQISL
ncbi:MAG: hypothetical protein JW938_05040, partial [Candidatus Omnitrophica bacterium]|nr:hypothetical protein [Candidatus Omnitrophota bacterium]